MTVVLRTRDELRSALAAAGRPVGLVPTMGWLHDGHRALMRRARAADATTVVTIFVNPRQFNVSADFDRYPRTLGVDSDRLKEVGATVLGILAVIDREQGGPEAISAAGYTLTTLFNRKDLGI